MSSLLINTSEKTIITSMMKRERMSLTCAPGGENNRGMEIIGRMPIKGEGFTAEDIEGLGPYFVKLMEEKKVSVLDLNALSLDEYIDNGLEDEDQARVLILRDWAKGADKARVVSRIFFSHLRCSAEFEINSICPGPDIHT